MFLLFNNFNSATDDQGQFTPSGEQKNHAKDGEDFDFTCAG